MSKKIDLIVTSCSDCPYCVYNTKYGMSYDSSYDCSHEKGHRIIDYWKWSNSNNKNRLCNIVDEIPIPSWCPLEDSENSIS